MSKITLQVYYEDSGITSEEEFKSIPKLGETITHVDGEKQTKYRVETSSGIGHGNNASKPFRISLVRLDD